MESIKARSGAFLLIGLALLAIPATAGRPLSSDLVAAVPPVSANPAYNWNFKPSPRCHKTIDLTPGQWTMFTLPCRTEISGASTLGKILGDDLEGKYDVDWGVFRRDAATDSYYQLALSDTLETGRGYWVMSKLSGQSFAMEGQFPTSSDIELTGDAAGRFNLVGNPHDFAVNWTDTHLLDSGEVIEITRVDEDTQVSRTFHIWDGAEYVASDGFTAGMDRVIDGGQAFWVEVFGDDLRLRLPDRTMASADPQAAVGGQAATASSPVSADRVRVDGAWYLRIVAEAGDRTSRNAVLGQLPDAGDDRDLHDLEKLAPFGSTFLTVMFPHPDWNGQEWGFASDFRSLRREPSGEWTFVVYASANLGEVTLSFEGPESVLKQSRLWAGDSPNGEADASKGQTFTFTPQAGLNHFTLRVDGH